MVRKRVFDAEGRERGKNISEAHIGRAVESSDLTDHEEKRRGRKKRAKHHEEGGTADRGTGGQREGLN